MAKPTAKFQAGQVTAALWQNEISVGNGKTTTILKATIQRRFKDRDGNWKSSNSFNRNEVPLAIYCLHKCLEFMIEGQQDGDDANNVQEEVVM